jgi:hypothetical protein
MTERKPVPTHLKLIRRTPGKRAGAGTDQVRACGQFENSKGVRFFDPADIARAEEVIE